METRELKSKIEYNLEVINNIWRSLWHPNKKSRSKNRRKKSWRAKLLG